VTTAIVIDGGFIVERRPNLCDTITGNDGNQVDMKVFYTCIIREAFRPEIILDNERTGPCGSSEKCVMNGGVPECVPKCAPNSGSSVMSEESCCGDGTIDSGEECDDGNTADADGCSSACQTEGSCGDGSCNGDETCYECPNDCGDCPPTCGDGICMPEIGEDCVSCPDDCITCGGCGDGSCNGNEDCSSCPGDCGSCGCQPGIASTFTNFIAFFGLAEECPPDPCEGVVCDDGNPCTDDSCSGGVCSHVGNGQCGSICSDGVCRPECPENCNDECTCPDQPPAEQCDGGWSCEDRSGVASTGFFGVLSGFWRSAVSFLTGSVATEPCNKNWVCKPSIFCSDSDGGVNTFLKGTTSVGSQTETDYCVDTFSVMEHWCNSDNKIYSGEFSCKYCIDGACTGDIPEEKECNYNGVQDNEEAGIDCGGGGCPPCMEENDPCADILDMYECLLNSETLNCAWNSDTNTCFKVMNA
jgi:cysteine-rich repeat protein